jgi:hypothetical protein
MPDTQKPGTFFLTFQRQLAASGQIEVLAGLLAHVHFLYEGWGQVALPLDGELKRIYSKAACMAVRACSDVEQQVARGKAERWALDNYMRFRMQQLKTTDHEESLQLLRDFVRAILDEHRFCLMHGPEVASVRDTLQMAEIMADDLGEPA